MDGLSPFDSSKAGVIVKLIVGKYDSNFANRHLHFLLHLALKFSAESRFDFIAKFAADMPQTFCHFSFRCLRKTRLILSSLQSFASPNFEFGSAKIFAFQPLLGFISMGRSPANFFELRRQRTLQSRSDLSPRSVSGDGANDAR